MKFNPRDEALAPIYERSIDAFGAELSDFFADRKTPVYFLKQQGDMDEIKKIAPDAKPPFFTFRPGDVSLFEEGISNEKLQRHGVNYGGPKSELDDLGRPVDPNKNFMRLNAVQVEVNIAVEYVCSYIEQFKFSQIWVPLGVRPVKFELDYKGIIIPCSMIFDKSITYSDIDFDSDSLVECQTNCALRTWMATEGTTRPITRYTVPEKIVGKRVGDKVGHRVYTDFEIQVDDENQVKVTSP